MTSVVVQQVSPGYHLVFPEPSYDPGSSRLRGYVSQDGYLCPPSTSSRRQSDSSHATYTLHSIDAEHGMSRSDLLAQGIIATPPTHRPQMRVPSSSRFPAPPSYPSRPSGSSSTTSLLEHFRSKFPARVLLDDEAGAKRCLGGLLSAPSGRDSEHGENRSSYLASLCVGFVLCQFLPCSAAGSSGKHYY